MKKTTKLILLILLTTVIVLVALWWRQAQTPLVTLNDSPETVQTQEEVTYNTDKKDDLIQVAEPQSGQVVSSPLEVSGKARGYWFFEASFPMEIINADGMIVGQSFATAEGEWMTEEFVDFTGEIEYEPGLDISGTSGFLILRKDNPSGLPENDDYLAIPIIFE